MRSVAVYPLVSPLWAKEKTMEDKMYWHNFVTGKDEYIETPKDFSDYVPQIGGRVLYQLYVEHKGMKPIEAACKVLEMSVGEAG